MGQAYRAEGGLEGRGAGHENHTIGCCIVVEYVCWISI